MSTHLKGVERERRLQHIRGKARARPRATRGPRFEQLDPAAQLELERYARQAGASWRTDLIADCLRGGTRRRAKFAELLCPLVRAHGPAWLRRELRVPWETRKASR